MDVGNSPNGFVHISAECENLPQEGARAHVNLQDEQLGMDIEYNFTVMNSPPNTTDWRVFDATGFDSAVVSISITDLQNSPLFCWIMHQNKKPSFPLNCQPGF